MHVSFVVKLNQNVNIKILFLYTDKYEPAMKCDLSNSKLLLFICNFNFALHTSYLAYSENFVYRFFFMHFSEDALPTSITRANL